jgi:hypothetical protein
VKTLAFGHDAGRKSSGQYASTSGPGYGPTVSERPASLSLDDDCADAFRRRLFDRPPGLGWTGSPKLLRLMRDDDLAECFQVKALDLLNERCSLARRGSEFDLRSGDAGGNFVSLLLMPG